MKLKQLSDLSLLTAADNPVSHAAHYRLYLIFHIRSLESLDGQLVSSQERTAADARFAQGLLFVIRATSVCSFSLSARSISTQQTNLFICFAEELGVLEGELERKESEMSKLKDALNQSTRDTVDSRAKNEAYVEKVKNTLQKIKELETELSTKDDLVIAIFASSPLLKNLHNNNSSGNKNFFRYCGDFFSRFS